MNPILRKRLNITCAMKKNGCRLPQKVMKWYTRQAYDSQTGRRIADILETILRQEQQSTDVALKGK
jgi:hypothetical protein